MKYNVGMFGGSFDPLHKGHLRVITRAASQCRKLFIVLSYCRKRDSIPMEYRYRWIRACTRHLDNVSIIVLEDDAFSKSEYEEKEYWEKGRDYVLEKIGGPVDVVYCGSDYKGTGRYENLYQCEVEYIERSELPVSSTQIRENPFSCWEYIPKVVRPYFVKRVLLIGGESTGKSTLAANLALEYSTNYLEEIGRDVCDTAGDEDLMIAEDFHEILIRHKAREMELVRESNKLIFIDTDALTTRFFAEFLLKNEEEKQKIAALADAVTGINRFDLILFLEPTVEFVQDGTRNEKIRADRGMYSNRLKNYFDRAGLEYYCLSGGYDDRLAEAKVLISEKLGV